MGEAVTSAPLPRDPSPGKDASSLADGTAKSSEAPPAFRVELAELRRQLIEQEHRLWPAIRQFFELREQRHGGEDARAHYRAARLALIRRLFFRPGAGAVAVAGVGLAGILVAVWTALLFQSQNMLFEEQNSLFRAQNEALVEQFADEARDRTITRRAALLDIIYTCTQIRTGEGEDLCVPTANARARKEAAEAFVEIERQRGADVDFTDADFGDVSLQLAGADLSGANFSRATLIDANLTDANLTNAYFINARLDGTILVGADLTNAEFYGASLFNGGLTNATLIDANFTNADLTNADFAGADLSGANLAGATLNDANLGSARGLSQRQITFAKGNHRTVLPEGLVRPVLWNE